MTNKEIFQQVYQLVLEKKSKNEIAYFIYNASKKANKDFLNVTDALLNNRKIDSYKLNIDYKLLGQMQNIVYQIRKDYRKGILEFSKESIEESSKIKENNIQDTQHQALLDINKLSLEKQDKYFYFQLLLQALNMKMPIDMGLVITARKENAAVNDISKKGTEYLLKFASRRERNLFLTKSKSYQAMASSHSLDYQVNAIIYQIFQILNNSKTSKEQAIKDLLEDADINVLNRLSRRIDNVFISKQLEIKKLLGTEKATADKLIIDAALSKLIKSKNVKSTVNLQQNPVTNNQAINIIEAFLKFNGSIKDFAKLDIYPYKNHSPKMVNDKLLNLCLQYTPNLINDVKKHLQELEEYELSYVSNLLDIVIYYRRNGYPTADGKTRPFDILDYYAFTNLPLEQLRSYAIKNNLLCPEDAKYLSSFSGHNVMGNIFQNYELSLETLKDEYNVSGCFSDTDRELTLKEKLGIYEFLNYYKLPITPYTINTAIRRYANGTLFIARFDDDNENLSFNTDNPLKKELVR